MTKKPKPVKRLDPNKLIPAKNFKPQTLSNDQVVSPDANLEDIIRYQKYIDEYPSQPKSLQDKIREYQQRALEIVDQEFELLEAEQQRELDRKQKLLEDSQLDDKKPKTKIVTRASQLEKIKDRNGNNN